MKLHKDEYGYYDAIDTNDGQVILHLRPGTKLNEANAENFVKQMNQTQRFYISGPISLYENTDRNVPAFLEMERKLDQMGYLVENPIHNIPPSFMQGQELWQFQLRKDLVQLVKCDAIVLLPNWEKSNGSKLELFVALQLGLDVYNANLEKLNVSYTNPEFEIFGDSSYAQIRFLDPFGNPS